MPIVTVLGVPETASDLTLSRLFHDIKREIASVEELGLTEKQVSVFFPRDLGESTRCSFNSNEVCVLIAIYAKPERSDEVIHRMAERLQKRLKNNYFQDSLVEVLPQMLDPKHCSSSAT